MIKPLQEIIQYARSDEVKKCVARNLYLLKPNPWHFRYIDLLISGMARSEKWFNHLTFLFAFSHLCKPETYLEVGVHKGGSLSQVVSQSPNVNVMGFDLWPPNYAAIVEDWPLPHFASSPEHIREEISKFNMTGQLQFISGDTQITLPKFLSDNPSYIADIALIDGDHSDEGARRDLNSIIGRAKCIVFDDIIHPYHPWLHKAWKDIILPRASEADEDMFNVGTAVAIIQ